MLYMKGWLIAMVTYGIVFIECLALLFGFYGARLASEEPLTAFIDISYYLVIFAWLIACSVFSVRSYEYSERRSFFDMKQQEKEIKEWKRLMEDLPEPVIFADQGEIQFCNRSARLLVSSNSGNENIDYAKFLEDCSQIIEKGTKRKLSTIIKEKSLLNESEFVYKKDNVKRNLQIKCVQTEASSGITEYIFNDITAVKALERTKVKEQCFDVLLATASHDIKTPLNIMLGILDGISDQTLTVNSKKQIKIAFNCGQRMLHYLKGLALIRHINLGTLGVDKRIFNPREIASGILQLLEYSANVKKITITMSITGDVPDIICSDKEMYTLILQNILENALKYTFIGSVDLNLAYSEETHMLKTTITDTGIGMTPEQLTNSGILFQKSRNRCSLNPQGLGLGLYLSKTLSSKLDGNLDIKSELGKGTQAIFTIRSFDHSEAIPEVRRMQMSMKSSLKVPILQTNEHNKCKCPRVLIVDDEPLNLLVLGSYLNSVKIPFAQAENGKIALDLIEELINKPKCDFDECKGFKVVFMDINMPVMDGIQSTIKIKEIEKEGKIQPCTVVAVTAAAGLDDPEIYAKYISHGFTELCIFSNGNKIKI